MIANWTPVTEALARMRAQNIKLPIWWRDDDAVAETPQIEMLSNLSVALSLPVHIAAVPDLVEPSLPSLIGSSGNLVPLVHGWRHVKHEAQGKKNTEFGVRRPGDVEELEAALARMQELFGQKLVPLFVPPWNLIDASLFPELARLGYSGVSTYGARASREAFSGLAQMNTHIDPIDWRGTRGLIRRRQLIQHIADILNARIEGRQDQTEPMGLLTHHLIHDRKIWRFIQDCLVRLLDGGAVPVDLGKLKGELP